MSVHMRSSEPEWVVTTFYLLLRVSIYPRKGLDKNVTHFDDGMDIRHVLLVLDGW